jgi:hypothetical protein
VSHVASPNLATNLKDAGINISADDLMRAIQGGGENEQQPIAAAR